MADLRYVTRLLNGIQRQIDLALNSLIVGSIKIGGTTNSELTKIILDNLILTQNGSDVGALHNHDSAYTKITDLASTAAGKGASLVGIQDAGNLITATTVEGALAENRNRTEAAYTLAAAAIPATEKGAALGVASLDSGGKVPVAQLPNSIMEYKGTYDASTNTPSLVNGTGNIGDVYRVTVAGAGVNSLSFVVGDYAIYNGTTWEKAHSGSDAVVTVNGFAGVVVLTTDNIAEGSVNLYFSTARARTAAVVNSTAGAETDQAPSVSATKSYVASQIAAITSDALVRSLPAGQALSATTLVALRWAGSSETLGSLYKADNDATTADNFHVMGLAYPASAVTAGSNVSAVKLGRISVPLHGFAVGPLYLSTTGAITSTPPSAVNSAVVRVGYVQDTNTIDVQISVTGVN